MGECTKLKVCVFRERMLLGSEEKLGFVPGLEGGTGRVGEGGEQR